jgi:hypothetical protein
MSLMEALKTITIEAGSDLSSDQWKFVKVASDGQCDLNTTAGGRCNGVLLNDPAAAGRDAEVAIDGRVKVKAGGTVASGATVSSNATGLAVTSVTSGHHVLGLCLVGGASGELIEVQLGYQGVI